MPYRMVADVTVEWVGPGAGPMAALTAQNLPAAGSTGQILNVVSQTGGYIIPGTGTGTFPFAQIASADITTLLNSLTTDISAQLNLAANLARMQNWTTGQP